MMRHTQWVLGLVFSLLFFCGFGQILNPAKWETSYEQVSADEFDLVFTARLDKGWYVYSQYIEDGGPIPTGFIYEEGSHFALIGKNVEKSDHRSEGMDPIFEMQVIKFAKLATFTQRIRVKDISKPITGYLEYMTCDDKQCLAPTEVDFRFELTSTIKTDTPDKARQVTDTSTQEEIVPEPNELPIDTLRQEGATEEKPVVDFQIITEPLDTCGEPLKTEKTNWGIFILGFLGGLIALLTPCVFPMIPLTVSFFTKGSNDPKKGIMRAGLYGFFILLVYVLLSIPFHLMDSINPDILNEISTNVWLNILFFVVFVVFAFSFFGYFELTLPSSWTNKASQAENAGGIIGIFFMALTLSLVSFSCTGPILGSLLAGALSSDGGAMQLTAGMTGFGLALALPFTLFAAFPGWMKNLPKSGGWLNTVKVVLGFLELALALKFLSNADLVKHWGLLKIEPFLGLWIVIFVLMALYIFGKIRFPHDSIIDRLKPGRIFVGLIIVAFVIYLASGFRYSESTKSFTPLKLLSGLAPPVGYSWVYPNDCPQNLNCFKDLDEGVAYARAQNKPIMLDFTGHACVNCRKMEEHVWPDPRVFNMLNEEYVLISLYVDEKIELPEAEQVEVMTVNGNMRKLRTTGHKWAHFQAETFQINSQPFYVLMAPDGQVLNYPVAYTPDADEYANFLACGLEAFKSK
jgi:thiol:disulfide interchange protein DsbD